MYFIISVPLSFCDYKLESCFSGNIPYIFRESLISAISSGVNSS